MIQDARIAKRTLRLLQKAKGPLWESLQVVKVNCSAEEYDEYARAMSHVLGRIAYLLENTIFCQHPSMAPAGFPKSVLKTWAKARGNSEGAKGPIGPTVAAGKRSSDARSTEKPGKSRRRET